MTGDPAGVPVLPAVLVTSGFILGKPAFAMGLGARATMAFVPSTLTSVYDASMICTNFRLAVLAAAKFPAGVDPAPISWTCVGAATRAATFDGAEPPAGAGAGLGGAFCGEEPNSELSSTSDAVGGVAGGGGAFLDRLATGSYIRLEPDRIMILGPTHRYLGFRLRQHHRSFRLALTLGLRLSRTQCTRIFDIDLKHTEIGSADPAGLARAELVAGDGARVLLFLSLVTGRSSSESFVCT